jgi:hypothetical protein
MGLSLLPEQKSDKARSRQSCLLLIGFQPAA